MVYDAVLLPRYAFVSSDENHGLNPTSYWQVQNHEDSLQLLKVLPDRVGHGTFLHPEMGGSQEMLELMLKHSLPLGEDLLLQVL